MSATWYLMRGSGIVSLLLLTASIVLGVAARSKWRPPGRTRAISRSLHRNIAVVATTFIGLHVLTALVHPDSKITLIDLLLPFGAGQHPLAMGMGTIAFDLLLAVMITSALRRQLGDRVWRRVHWATYALWPVALLHGLGIASDLHTWWMWAVVSGSVAAVGSAVSWRIAIAEQTA